MDILGKFYYENSCCVYSLESPHRDIPKLSTFSYRPGAMIDPKWLELPMSRKNSNGPKVFPAVVCLNPLNGSALKRITLLTLGVHSFLSE